MITEILSIVIVSLLFIALIAQTIYYAKKHRRLIRSIAELLIEKEALIYKIDKLTLETSKDVNDGFIKFLSESRQAAFDYIENVQASIGQYLTAIENGNSDEITTARMELFSHLPEVPESENNK